MIVHDRIDDQGRSVVGAVIGDREAIGHTSADRHRGRADRLLDVHRGGEDIELVGVAGGDGRASKAWHPLVDRRRGVDDQRRSGRTIGLPQDRDGARGAGSEAGAAGVRLHRGTEDWVAADGSAGQRTQDVIHDGLLVKCRQAGIVNRDGVEGPIGWINAVFRLGLISGLIQRDGASVQVAGNNVFLGSGQRLRGARLGYEAAETAGDAQRGQVNAALVERPGGIGPRGARLGGIGPGYGADQHIVHGGAKIDAS